MNNLEIEIVIFKENFANIYFLLILEKCVFRVVSFVYFEIYCILGNIL